MLRTTAPDPKGPRDPCFIHMVREKEHTELSEVLADGQSNETQNEHNRDGQCC